MVTLYVRVAPKKGIEHFYRCAFLFTQAWRKLLDLDEATANRLGEEQMLEVSVDEPADYEESEQAGDSAGSTSQSGQSTGTPATAPTGTGDGADNLAAAFAQVAASAGTGVTVPEDPALRLEAIRTAISKMDKQDASLWTNDGKPKTDAVSAIVGWPVTAAERDAAIAPVEDK